ncbi:hypothetical protein GBA52_010172, partial [Prunus armeniaca]
VVHHLGRQQVEIERQRRDSPKRRRHDAIIVVVNDRGSGVAVAVAVIGWDRVHGFPLSLSIRGGYGGGEVGMS